MAYSRLMLAVASVTALRQSTRRDIGALTAGALLVPARAVAALPSADRVPLFVITTADGSTPLFTDADGTRASFFAERRDAEAKLKSLKGAGDAVVMSLPLSEALDLKKQPASELGGEFTLSARKGERDDASAIAGARRSTPGRQKSSCASSARRKPGAATTRCAVGPISPTRSSGAS